jgi:hypothetical protein
MDNNKGGVKTMKIIDIQTEEPKREHTTTEIDIDIIEYLYAATWDDITKDDKLMDLILSNGWYKQALMDAQGMTKLKIFHNNNTHELTASKMESTLDIIHGKSQAVIMGATYKNIEQKNINKVNGE